LSVDEKKVLVRLLEGEENSAAQVFEIEVPGYYFELRGGPDGVIYEHLTLPGAAHTSGLGAPDLPVARLLLGLPLSNSGAQEVDYTVEVVESQVVDSVRVWPRVQSSTDGLGGPDSSPEVFVIDPKVYAKTRTPDLVSKGVVAVSSSRMGVKSGELSVPLAIASPASEQVEILTKLKVTVEAREPFATEVSVSRETHKKLKNAFVNWSRVKDFFPWSNLFCDRYIAIYPDDSYAPALAPLLNQKRAEGMWVTQKTMGTIGRDYGSDCDGIRTALQVWESKVPKHCDAYALLVGDTDEIPLCTSPTGEPTDDLYASTNGDDLDEEIYLGRLSVDSPSDLENQVAKIMAYSESPSLFFDYGSSLLWAHKENAPNKYVAAHEVVRTNFYAQPPSFTTHYGHLPGINDQDVVDYVNKGMGLVAYRGHGSDLSTATGWNLDNQFFNSLDVNALTNPMNRSPVLWSFACTNSSLNSEDSISELWMSATNGQGQPVGAVSAYGATEPSLTLQNHSLDEWMFPAVFDEGLVRQSFAIRRAEDVMGVMVGDSNSWLYLLLGDPAMDIRREAVPLPQISWVISPRDCIKYPCQIEADIRSAMNLPEPLARLTVVASPESQSPRQMSSYADEMGRVRMLLPDPDADLLHFYVRTDLGQTLRDSMVLD
jgi:hypothetical protein